MYSQAPREIPNGYSGSAFRHEPCPEPPCEASPGTKRGVLSPILERFRIGRFLKGIDLEDLLILALALLLLLEDGEGDLFPILLLFLLFQ